MNKRFLIAAAVMVSAFIAVSFSSQGRAAPATVSGVVAGSYFTPPAGSAASKTEASYYEGARICFDINNDGVCGTGETSAATNAKGAFVLTGAAGPIAAELSTDSKNGGQPVTRRLVFRASKDQVAADLAAGHSIVVSPLSTELVRMMEADNLDYATARKSLAQRLNVPAEALLSDPNMQTAPAVRSALLSESVILTGRFTLAATMVDRKEVSALTMKAAQQAAMNLEGIPRYDHLFIIMLENKATSSIKNSRFAPKINAYLNAGNQFTSYYSTGNPSEPNYTAVAAADDFGITDDENWNCVPAGDTADLPEDPLPAGMPPCTKATSHNIKGRANLFTARKVFFHNGAIKSLKEAIRFYNTRDTDPEHWYPKVSGVLQIFDDLPAAFRDNIDKQAPLDSHARGSKPAMSDQEMDDLEAFLKTLTDNYKPAASQ